jgi:hypothetical protein
VEGKLVKRVRACGRTEVGIPGGQARDREQAVFASGGDKWANERGGMWITKEGGGSEAGKGLDQLEAWLGRT